MYMECHREIKNVRRNSGVKLRQKEKKKKKEKKEKKEDSKSNSIAD